MEFSFFSKVVIHGKTRWFYSFIESIAVMVFIHLIASFVYIWHLTSFRPKRVLFRPGGVNLRVCLCGVPMYASAQPLDFLVRTKNSAFPIRKPTVSHPEFPDGN